GVQPLEDRDQSPSKTASQVPIISPRPSHHCSKLPSQQLHPRHLQPHRKQSSLPIPSVSTHPNHTPTGRAASRLFMTNTTPNRSTQPSTTRSSCSPSCALTDPL